MKLQVGRRLASVLLAFIVLVSGMCVAVKSADSYFVCETDTSQKGAISKPEQFSIVKQICSPEMLRQERQTEFYGNHRRIAIRRFSQVAMMSVVVGEILPGLAYPAKVSDYDYCQTVASHIAMVRYIQQQDGEK